MFQRASCGSVVILCLFAPAPSASAVVQEFFDRTDWETAVGEFTTLDFTGFPLNTIITDQFSPLGIIFTDGNDRIDTAGPAYPNDGWGLQSLDGIRMDFDVPRTYLGLDYPGGMQIQFLIDGKIIYDSGPFHFPVGGIGNFAGVLSSEPFDQVVLIDALDGDINIDDLHFGGAVPAPGMIALLGLAGLLGRTRRRK